MTSVSNVASGALLGAVAVLILPYMGGILKAEVGTSDGPGDPCEVAGSEWRFHVAPCESVRLAAQVRLAESGAPALQLLFNSSSSRASIVSRTHQGVTTEENVVADEAMAALDVHEGATVLVQGRCYAVTTPVDERTQASVDCYRQSTFAMIKPDAFPKAGEVLARLEEIASLRIAGLRLLKLDPPLVRRFYAEHSQRSFFEDLVSYITSGPVVALHLVGPDAVRVWREALGPTDSNKARLEAPASVRALFGADKQRNAAHGSDSAIAARRELSFFFKDASPGLLSSTEPLTETSCLVLPHVLRGRSLGGLWSSLGTDHASATAAAQLVRLNYLDAWRYVTGLLLPRAQPTQQQLEKMQELLSGPAVSLELQAADADEDSASYASRFKDVIGPLSPTKARKTAVESVRANYGISDVKSGLFCPWYDWRS